MTTDRRRNNGEGSGGVGGGGAGAGYFERPAYLRFALVYSALMAVYFALTLSIDFERAADSKERPVVAALIAVNRAAREYVIEPYQTFLARSAGKVFGLFGQTVAVEGRTVRSSSLSVEVTGGCDALELTVLWWGALVSYPSRWSYRFLGLLAGTVTIAGLNFSRIVSLWFIGIHGPKMFEVTHFIVWPFLLTIALLLIFVVWIRYARTPAGATA